jgi:hypothetical protein
VRTGRNASFIDLVIDGSLRARGRFFRSPLACESVRPRTLHEASFGFSFAQVDAPSLGLRPAKPSRCERRGPRTVKAPADATLSGELSLEALRSLASQCKGLAALPASRGYCVVRRKAGGEGPSCHPAGKNLNQDAQGWCAASNLRLVKRKPVGEAPKQRPLNSGRAKGVVWAEPRMELSAAFREALDREPGIVAVLDQDGTIGYLNWAWDETARRDLLPASCLSGAVLGQRYLDYCVGELKPHLARAFEQSAQAEARNRSVFMHGECNTPTYYRKLTTRISALWTRGLTASSGYIVQNDVINAGQLGGRYPLVEHPLEAWRDADGIIVQCACCRRVRSQKTALWEMSVALLVQSAERTSHGLCELCIESYYGAPFAVA